MAVVGHPYPYLLSPRADPVSPFSPFRAATFRAQIPKALPWAIAFGPVGAATSDRAPISEPAVPSLGAFEECALSSEPYPFPLPYPGADYGLRATLPHARAPLSNTKN